MCSSGQGGRYEMVVGVAEVVGLLARSFGQGWDEVHKHNHCFCNYKCLQGTKFNVYGKPEKELVHTVVNSNSSDLPARCKMDGLQSHNSKYFMCPMCHMEHFCLSIHKCFDPQSQ